MAIIRVRGGKKLFKLEVTVNVQIRTETIVLGTLSQRTVREIVIKYSEFLFFRFSLSFLSFANWQLTMLKNNWQYIFLCFSSRNRWTSQVWELKKKGTSLVSWSVQAIDVLRRRYIKVLNILISKGSSDDQYWQCTERLEKNVSKL